MILQRDQICNLIPHAGNMCLLDRVEQWNETEIFCSTRSHLRLDNPLRRGDRLASIHALEYGGQAMAVHGGLLARQQQGCAQGGVLVAIRDVRLYRERLDDLDDALQVEAIQLLTSGDNQIYQVRLSSDDNIVAEGRLSVMNILEANR
jgi:predicted hotdog family 3-hydroxylacyl-ACP dehydratase